MDYSLRGLRLRALFLLRSPSGLFRQYDVETAPSRDLGDERPCPIGEESLHARQATQEGRREICGRHVAPSEDESANASFHEGFALDRAVTDALVLGDRDPRSFPDLR